MKLILGLGLLCLLVALARSDDGILDESELQIIADNNELPLPIAYIYENGVYTLSLATKMNWFEATAACARAGYTLAAIPNSAAQQRIFTTFRNSGFQRLLTEPVWTSGSNQANSFQWSWYSTGKPITNNNFVNYANPPTNQVRCLGVNGSSGIWTAEDCNAKRYFMCEKRCP